MEILLAGVGTIEIVHAAAHSAVMFGIILPSRDRLKGSVNYFIIDLLSVQAACFLLHFHALFFAIAHLFLHVAHIVSWDKAEFCRGIISWSSTSWTGSRLQPIFVLGTTFDVLLHIYYGFSLLRATQHPVLYSSVALVIAAGAMLNWLHSVNQDKLFRSRK